MLPARDLAMLPPPGAPNCPGRGALPLLGTGRLRTLPLPLPPEPEEPRELPPPPPHDLSAASLIERSGSSLTIDSDDVSALCAVALDGHSASAATTHSGADRP